MAGVTALLRYAVEADGVGWPDELVTADGDHRSWHQLLVERVAAAIPYCAFNELIVQPVVVGSP
jgi:hypothetical protein